jgi:hypothetical protein
MHTFVPNLSMIDILMHRSCAGYEARTHQNRPEAGLKEPAGRLPLWGNAGCRRLA